MVSTAKKMAANQANGAKSTGPQTEEGKERAAENSTKHGLRSNSAVMPWESQEEFDGFRERMLACLGPGDELERMLAERFVTEAWRARRVAAYEARVFKAQRDAPVLTPAQKIVDYRGGANANELIRDMLANDLLPKLSAYQQRIESSMFRYLREFERAQTSLPVPKAGTPAGQ